jgi:serine phosphatase RsbU (regulator of sigma subunit)
VTGRLCLAGHPPALIRRADGRVQEVGVTGPLLGYAEEVRLTDARFRLAFGDLLLLYTDGAVEARPAPDSPEPRQPMFDDDALIRTLAGTHGLGAAATTSRIADALAARHDGWASDDTALLALYLPPA